jgi:hypothetical protein
MRLDSALADSIDDCTDERYAEGRPQYKCPQGERAFTEVDMCHRIINIILRYIKFSYLKNTVNKQAVSNMSAHSEKDIISMDTLDNSNTGRMHRCFR